jgi:hypothetical protein
MDFLEHFTQVTIVFRRPLNKRSMIEGWLYSYIFQASPALELSDSVSDLSVSNGVSSS